MSSTWCPQEVRYSAGRHDAVGLDLRATQALSGGSGSRHSYLKRRFGLDRCNVHSAVFAHNLMRLVRLMPS